MAEKPSDFAKWYREFPERYAPFKPGKAPDPKAKYYRFIELDCTRAQEDQRTIEAVLSTETPVQRGHYREILKHTEDAVNLERAKDGLPLLWNHEAGQHVGLAENVRVYEGKLRARFRFSDSALGREKFADVQAGILRGVSIGYTIEKAEQPSTDEIREDLIATRWMPFEASLVTIPADTAAGIGRSLEMGLLSEPPADLEVLDWQNAIRNRYDPIRGIEQHPEFQPAIEELQRLILSAKAQSERNEADELLFEIYRRASVCESVEKDGAFLKMRENSGETKMEKFEPFFVNTRAPRGDDINNFSLCRALSLTFDPGAARYGGPEYERMQDAARRRGKSLGDRYTLPEEVLFRSVTKGTSGGNLVGVEHLGGQFVPALRERLITGRMGATILPGLVSDIQIPRSTADSSAGWIAGDGSDAVSSSDPTYDKISMSPKTVGCYTTLSRKMLLQADPASEQLVRDSLAFAVAKALDSAAINGSGLSNQPLGIFGQTGVASSTYVNGGTPSFGDIVDLEGDLMVDDADMGNLGYVCNGALAAILKQTPVVSGQDRMIWTADGEGQGRMNGYRAMTSNLIPAGYILFGNWRDLLVCLWSGLDFTIDPYTRASYGDVVITIFQDADIAVRHGESFAEIHEAAP